MHKIDLRADAKVLRSKLAGAVESLSNEMVPGGTVSALEIGYDCNQGGCFFLHLDDRSVHHRDGKWTNHLDTDNTINMPHWARAMDSCFEGDDVRVTKVDGHSFTIPGFDEDSDVNEGDEGAEFSKAVGQMLKQVVLKENSNGVFSSIAAAGTFQFDFEDFNGEWAWPAAEDLGKTNIASWF